MRKLYGYFVFWVLITFAISGGIMTLLTILSMFNVFTANFGGVLLVSALASFVITASGDVEVTIKND